ncbi:MAG: neuromedin U [Candidatus Coatesbacteria bacterium]|nr:MAG: neuromedin U [Candidatus Coatesbacteria bacterium]
MAALASFGYAQSEEELAKKTQNPVADLISFPLQNNTNFGLGTFDRVQNVLNIQPVIPINAGPVNVITRTIAPVVYQPDFVVVGGKRDVAESGGTFGLGDVNATAFITPAAGGKVIWGAGPILSFPTATDDVLGTKKWGVGPSAVVLAMPGRWTVGVLVNNVWSVAGDENRSDVNAMLVQYFANYNLPQGWYLVTAPINTANWKAGGDDRWTVPFGAGVGKLHRFGKLPVNLSAHGYYNAVHAENLPYADWTARLQVQFLFPK